jgi:hypothetical protein
MRDCILLSIEPDMQAGGEFDVEKASKDLQESLTPLWVRRI